MQDIPVSEDKNVEKIAIDMLKIIDQSVKRQQISSQI